MNSEWPHAKGIHHTLSRFRIAYYFSIIIILHQVEGLLDNVNQGKDDNKSSENQN